MTPLTRISIVLLLVLALAVAPALGQQGKLAGKTRLELRLGVWTRGTATTVNVGPGGIATDLDNTGWSGALAVNHWLADDLALDILAGGMVADIESAAGTSGVTSRTATVAPLLLGARYYFPRSALDGSWLPYCQLGVGPFIGTESKVEVGSTVYADSHTEIAFGGRVGLGVDVLLSRRFTLGLSTGWNLMSDFSDPVGGRKNYTAPDFSFSLGFVFGGDQVYKRQTEVTTK